MKRLTWMSCAAFLALGGCKGSKAEEAPPKAEGEAVAVEKHSDEKEHEELPKQIKLTPEVVAQAKVSTAPVRKLALAVTVELSGQVVADPDHVAMLGARTSGRIVRVLAKEGDPLKAGQAVVVLSAPELAAKRAQLAALRARAEAADKNAQRLRSLVEARLGSEQDAVAATAEARALATERDAIVQAIRSLGAPVEGGEDGSLLTVTSPIDGQLIQRDFVQGQMIEPAHVLGTVADLSHALFQAQLFEKDLEHIDENAPAEVRLNGYPEQAIAARVLRVAAQVDPQTHTLSARLSMADAGTHARLGLFGKAWVSLSGKSGELQLVVPQSAVTDLGDKKVVFVLQKDGDYEWHAVTLGDSAGGQVAVLAGLSEGEQVVVTGVHTLKSSVLKSTMKDED
jgi:cobalt-zinc-cadmium efflux system membrane fusion protein